VVHTVDGGRRRSGWTWARRVLVAATVALGLTLGLPSPPSLAATVGSSPADWTPYLVPSPVNQRVEELQPCKRRMYAVGSMTAVGRGSATFARSNVFSFSAKTGAMTSWAPQVNGPVRSIAFSKDCRTVYLGGAFTRVNRVAVRNLVAVGAVTGKVKRRFKHHVNGPLSTVRYAHGAVIIGGAFSTVNGARRTSVASLRPVTGVVSRYLHLRITRTSGQTRTNVYNSQLSHDRDRLLIEGVFSSINGHPRQQAAVLDLGKHRVRLSGWSSPELSQACQIGFYVRGGSWSPNDRTIYLASTGIQPTSGPGSGTNEPRAGLCDSLAAFPSAERSVSHTWINYTGCDSLYSAVSDRDNVYVGGHERWADNADGCNDPGPGAVSRPGIGSINPRTGMATSWNPTRSRGRGAGQLLLTKAGLWVASDTWIDGSSQQCSGVSHHGGICFFPY
jgi:hypothetical protein